MAETLGNVSRGIATLAALLALGGCGGSDDSSTDGAAGTAGSATGGSAGTAGSGTGGTAGGGTGGTAGTAGTAGNGTGGAGAAGAAGAGGSAAGGGGAGGSATAGAGGSAGGAGAGGGTAGSGTGGGGAAGAAGGAACTAIANVGATVTDTFMSGATVPVGKGGAIVDGTYTMTEHIGYMGSSTQVHTHSFTMQFAGTTIRLTGHDDAKADQSATLAMVADAATGAFSMTTTCPVAGGKVGAIDSYTATPTEVRFYESSKHQETVFTKKLGCVALREWIHEGLRGDTGPPRREAAPALTASDMRSSQ